MPKQIFQRPAPIKHVKIGKQKNGAPKIPNNDRFIRVKPASSSKKKPTK